MWQSTADGHFSIAEDTEGEDIGRGTVINLHLKPEAQEYTDVRGRARGRVHGRACVKGGSMRARQALGQRAHVDGRGGDRASSKAHLLVHLKATGMCKEMRQQMSLTAGTVVIVAIDVS